MCLLCPAGHREMAGWGPENPGMAPKEALRHPRARGAGCDGLARLATVRWLGGDPKTLGWLPKRPSGTPGHGVPVVPALPQWWMHPGNVFLRICSGGCTLLHSWTHPGLIVAEFSSAGSSLE